MDYFNINKRNFLLESSLDKRTTITLRAFLIIGIMLHHYWGAENTIVLYFFSIAGFTCVAIFLFLSGYGNYKSYASKGVSINWLIRRIERILLPYIIIFIIDTLFLNGFGNNYDIVQCLVNLTIPGRILWYLKVQLALYILFFIIFSIKKLSDTIKTMAISGVTLLYVLVAAFLAVPVYWYMTILFFCVGIIFAKYEQQFFEIFAKHKFLYTLLVGIFWLLLFGIQFLFGEAGIGNYMNIIYEIVFSAFIILLTMYFKYYSNILAIIGCTSFEIYLSHLVVLDIFKAIRFDFSNIFVFVLWFVISIILARVIFRFDNLILNKIHS